MQKYSIDEFYNDYSSNRNIHFIRSAIYRVFKYYKLIHSQEFELIYDDRLEEIKYDNIWIKAKGFIDDDPSFGANWFRYNIPMYLRNEMNIPVTWIFKENWKELIEDLIKKEKSEYIMRKLYE